MRGCLAPVRAPEPSSIWMTMEEVAERLGISPREAYRRAWAGELPCCKRYGHRWRTLRVDFERFLVEGSLGSGVRPSEGQVAPSAPVPGQVTLRAGKLTLTITISVDETREE